MNPNGIFERKWRDAGHARFTLRLKRNAMQQLDEMTKRFGCNRRDVIEALLLGNIPSTPIDVQRVMREHGFSEIEARDWLERAA